MLKFDHLIVAAADMEAAAMELMEAHGLASMPGGRHVGLGTGNRVVPLGPDYVELMGLADEGEAAGSILGRWLTDQIRSGTRLAAFVLRTDDARSVADRLDLELLPMGRALPDGTVLSWNLAGFQKALVEPPFPFFIEWEGSPDRHPGRAAAPHAVSPEGIRWIEVTTPDPVLLTDWLGPHDLDIRIERGAPGITEVGISTSTGNIVLRQDVA